MLILKDPGLGLVSRVFNPNTGDTETYLCEFKATSVYVVRP